MRSTIKLISLELVQAEHLEFTTYFSVYRENIRLRKDWNLPLTSVPRNGVCYWIMRQGQRIGRVLAEANKLGPLFVIPPNKLEDSWLQELVAYVISISDFTVPIEAAGILSSQLEGFRRNGFAPILTRHGMIRPTAPFPAAFPHDWTAGQPDRADIDELASVLHTAFRQGTADPSMTETEEGLKRDLADFFLLSEKDLPLRQASTVVWDNHTSSIAGVCLIGRNEGWPFISYLAVLPAYRGKGLATAMIQQALSRLYEQEPLLLLFVTEGNPAKNLYEKLGFWSAPSVTLMSYNQ
ncbi:GNAT family N-acetyltransferase [Paenibacillus aurantius]|uniref:GNAT family N-acetyltransferase n=1 Tax=Paenibacillus aurantius TaxID=2918900 RepID=A0AA96LIT9_9BACL|nr:GNAT family N-acetyltransferase [Paenibacillus aurantius]WNQ14093.1 GNAT family N-acetyltransferase [Paenibacillus aurantius]